MLEYVDDIMKRLLDSIVEVGMENCVNIIVVADHGMANRSCDQVYLLGDVRKKPLTHFVIYFNQVITN